MRVGKWRKDRKGRREGEFLLLLVLINSYSLVNHTKCIINIYILFYIFWSNVYTNS